MSVRHLAHSRSIAEKGIYSHMFLLAQDLLLLVYFGLIYFNELPQLMNSLRYEIDLSKINILLLVLIGKTPQLNPKRIKDTIICPLTSEQDF